MVRLLYILLLRLHPRWFRKRFGEEMTGIFDEEAGRAARAALLLDGVTSVLRQQLMRPARHEELRSAAGSMALADGVPIFHTFESRMVRRSALLHGVMLSAVSFGLVSFGIKTNGQNVPQLLIGAKYPRPQVLPVKRSSIAEGEPTTEIKVTSPPIDPLLQVARTYFKNVPVLDVLDTNQDGYISTWEMFTAASPLKHLDRDRNGSLSPEECGFSMGRGSFPEPDDALAARARTAFMSSNPVLAALDTDHNGVISADEIRSSSVSLRSLDKNHDGILAPAEVLPERMDGRAAMILSQFDTDRDGSISQGERTAERAQAVRELLLRADRNSDGMITASELTRELQIQDEVQRQNKLAGSAGSSAAR